MNHEKELLRGLWVTTDHMPKPLAFNSLHTPIRTRVL